VSHTSILLFNTRMGRTTISSIYNKPIIFNMFNELPLDKFYGQLASSKKVVKLLEEEYGSSSPEILAILKSDGELPDRHSSVHDWLYDLVHEGAEDVAEDSREGSAAGEYPIYVMCFEGVFFVSAPEFDDIGYFSNQEDAEMAISLNWF